MPKLSVKYVSARLIPLVMIWPLLMLEPAYGKNVIQIETGDYRSASWQFTLELSELWQKQFPDMETGFAPSHTEKIEERFSNLISKNSRFVIAPLDTTANQIMLSRPVKLAALLWSVYLVPIDIGGKKETIDLNNYRYWYILDHSVIISKLMNALNKPTFEESLRKDLQERTLADVKEEKPDIEAEDTKTGLIGISQVEGNDVLPDVTNLQGLDIGEENSNDRYKQSARIAGLDSFGTEILTVQSSMTMEVVDEYQEGILFIEMIGPIKNLVNSMSKPVSTISFNQNVRDFLVSVYPWIQPVYKSRAGLATLEFNMALYVHVDEDEEFVEDIVKLLSERPKTYFPQSYLFSNLAIQKTKEFSPLYMHPGSLKFFDLD